MGYLPTTIEKYYKTQEKLIYKVAFKTGCCKNTYKNVVSNLNSFDEISPSQNLKK